MRFELTDEQKRKVWEWANSLPEADTGAAGGRLTYMFTPTGLGVVLVVQDEITKQTINLTDYNEW